MKKPTIREMRLLNNGFIKNHSHNRFEAKAKNSLFLVESDERFEVSCSIQKSAANQGFITSLTPQTFFSIAISDRVKVTTSIKGYSSTVFFDITQYLDEKSFVKFKMVRNGNNFSYYLKCKDEFQIVAETALNGANDAISFGFFLKDNTFLKVENFYYKKEEQTI
jgi:hypothetical protein